MIKLKNTLVMLLMAVFIATSSAAEAKNNHPVVANGKNLKKMEFGFLFGPAIPLFDFRNSISDSYSSHWYDVSYVSYYFIEYDLTASFSSSIVGESESGTWFGGFFNYFFHKNFGFQFMLERSSHDVLLKATHSVTLAFDGDSVSERPPFDDTTGSLPVMPISFNVIVRFNSGKNISGYASGGLTYYKADIEAKSKVGDGFPYIYYWDEYDLDCLLYDSVVIPVDIDDSIGGPGANVGGGIVFTVQKNLGIVGDFRYYLGPEKDVYWMLRPGDYTYSINTGYYCIYDQYDIDYFLEEYGNNLRVRVSPSFFRLAFGLKFSF